MALVPELDVFNIDDSLRFYIEILGFSVLYARPEEKFAYLALEGSEIMLEEAAGSGRRFRTAALERPYGRGVNFQIEIGDVDSLHHRLLHSGYSLVVPLEERWYRMETTLTGNGQFVVPDPDGYLLRFFTDLGHKPIPQSENPA